MSGLKNFVARWSCRKRRAANTADATDARHLLEPNSPVGERDGEGGSESGSRADQASLEPTPDPSVSPFDPTKLPPIESITAQTDIRAFLVPGVPPELTREALRRAWTADPKIRDFVGLADYDWDFNAPDSVPGFGPLELSDEQRQRLIDMVGRSLAPKEDNEGAGPQALHQAGGSETKASVESTNAVAPASGQSVRTDGTSAHVEADDSGIVCCASGASEGHRDAAMQNDPNKSDNDQVRVKRLHGRALPQ